MLGLVLHEAAVHAGAGKQAVHAGRGRLLEQIDPHAACSSSSRLALRATSASAPSACSAQPMGTPPLVWMQATALAPPAKLFEHKVPVPDASSSLG